MRVPRGGDLTDPVRETAGPAPGKTRSVHATKAARVAAFALELLAMKVVLVVVRELLRARGQDACVWATRVHAHARGQRACRASTCHASAAGSTCAVRQHARAHRRRAKSTPGLNSAE